MLNTTCAPGAPTDPGNRTVVDACPPAAMVPNETGIEVVVGVPAKLTLVNCTALAFVPPELATVIFTNTSWVLESRLKTEVTTRLTPDPFTGFTLINTVLKDAL